MIITTIRIVKINHVSINMREEFVEEKINKLFVLISSKQGSSHHLGILGG